MFSKWPRYYSKAAFEESVRSILANDAKEIKFSASFASDVEKSSRRLSRKSSAKYRLLLASLCYILHTFAAKTESLILTLNTKNPHPAKIISDRVLIIDSAVLVVELGLFALSF